MDAQDCGKRWLMPNTPISDGNLAIAQDRRAFSRQPLRTLAYLNVGTDNGGIVLNLSPDGLAFRVVGPLDLSGKIDLGIQLPYSQERIVAAAQIVWLSDTKRLG